MIPKIIHQSAPYDQKIWHPIWNLCHRSVKKEFYDFNHILWTDEKINEFIKENFKNNFFDFVSIPLHIIRLDLFRYALLYIHGGIYIDMDMYCYKNFYNDLLNNINLVHSECPDEYGQKEIVQNSLMAAIPNEKFFKECFLEGLERSKNVQFNKEYGCNNFNVKFTSGPVLLKNMVNKFKNISKINILPSKYYNTCENYIYHEDFKVRHMSTGTWGKETYEMLNSLRMQENLGLPISKYLEVSYLDKTKININILDFYKTYKLKP